MTTRPAPAARCSLAISASSGRRRLSLFFEGTALMRRCRRLVTGPDFGSGDARIRLALGINGKDGMDKKALRSVVPGGPEPLAGRLATGDIDLRRILRRDDTAALHCSCGAHPMRCRKSVNIDLLRAQMTMRRHFEVARVASFAQHQRSRRHDPIEHQVRAPLGPLIALRRSPSRNRHLQTSANHRQCRWLSQKDQPVNLQLTYVKTVAFRGKKPPVTSSTGC